MVQPWVMFVVALAGLAWGLGGLAVMALAERGQLRQRPRGGASVRALANMIMLAGITLVSAVLVVTYWP